MAYRMAASSSRSRASAAIDDGFGQETGLPLIECPLCGTERILELIVKTTDNGNQGRVFFKCPRNVPGMPGRCRFYEFQKTYLKKLVELHYVAINLEGGLGIEDAGAGGFGEGEEAQSQLAANFGWNNMDKRGLEKKMDERLSMLKLFIVAVIAVVGVMYVFK